MISEEVHGTGVSLLPLTSNHVVPEYVAWLNDQDVMRFTEAGHDTHSLESARNYVLSEEKDSESLLWRVVENNAHVGNIRLSAINRHHKRCEIAIVIGMKNKWGAGVGTIAIDLASKYALTTLGLRKVSALIYAENERSIRAFAKAGFQEEARLKAHFLSAGRSIDGLWMCRFAVGL